MSVLQLMPSHLKMRCLETLLNGFSTHSPRNLHSSKYCPHDNIKERTLSLAFLSFSCFVCTHNLDKHLFARTILQRHPTDPCLRSQRGRRRWCTGVGGWWSLLKSIARGWWIGCGQIWRGGFCRKLNEVAYLRLRRKSLNLWSRHGWWEWRQTKDEKLHWKYRQLILWHI